MPTGSQRRVDSSNHSAKIDLSQQFAMDVLARRMVSSVPLGFVSLWNICHTCQPSIRSRPPNGLLCTFSAFRDSLVSFLDVFQYRFMHGDRDYKTATFE